MVGDDFLYSEDDEVMHRSLGCLLYLQFDVVDEKNIEYSWRNFAVANNWDLPLEPNLIWQFHINFVAVLDAPLVLFQNEWVIGSI